jgi:hypothetical protein
MSELQRPSVDAAHQDGPSGTGRETPIFSPGPEQRGGLPLAAWGVAALIVIVVVGALAIAGRKKPAPVPNTLQPADAYAASLPLSQLAMSEAAILSGGKLTYLDGQVRSRMTRTSLRRSIRSRSR